MATYINKQDLVKALRKQLSDNASVAAKACTRIFEYQTAAEQETESTRFFNGVGFTGSDAGILSSFAKQINRGRQLSEKQNYILKKLMPKYAGQLVKQSIEKGLIKHVNGVYITAEKAKSNYDAALAEEIKYKNMYAAWEAEQERKAFMNDPY